MAQGKANLSSLHPAVVQIIHRHIAAVTAVALKPFAVVLMFATTPSANSMQAMPMFTSKEPRLTTSLGVSLDLLPQGEAISDSAASTCPGSPGSSSSSSEEVSVGSTLLQKQSTKSDDSGALARRRGRSVLMLNELVMDLEILAARGSPSVDSMLALASESATMCTPSTMQMMSFSPLKSAAGSGVPGMCLLKTTQQPETAAVVGAPNIGDAPQLTAAGIPLANQVVEQSMMCTSPVKRSVDASQRSPPCASRLGAAAAGGDASQRNPIGRLSLGVAVIGGDASQRTPPHCTNCVAEHINYTSPASMSMQQNSIGTSILPNPSDAAWPHAGSGNSQGITGTCPAVQSPDSSCSSTMQDASQRNPAGSAATNLAIDVCSEALKSWLSGASGEGFSASDVDLAERLRAAAPDSYED